jgi:hypothetical protein
LDFLSIQDMTKVLMLKRKLSLCNLVKEKPSSSN